MGGCESLLVYRLAVTIDDGTILFCQKFLPEYSEKRTVEQMIQASRSGKQNIVEGSLEKSFEGTLNLPGWRGPVMVNFSKILRTF
ncbi:hypothetical protein C4578_03520 [Candidatus Microgenomates bacterium]|jgi:hypothetical protein|nr:MAG: hypothetical protein C4578_03520 [Candidatus Microgenomates bacterium]